MTTYAYSEVLNEVANQAQKLTLEEQLQLLEDLAGLIRQQVSLKQVSPKRKHDITELRGLGKEIWEGVDVAQHINEERDSQDR